MAQGTANTAPGQQAAVIGGMLGLWPALGVGLLRFINQETPEFREQMLGNLAFALVLTSPFLLALVVSRFRNPAARGALLLVLAILSLAAAFIALSGVTLILLPASVVLFVAAGRALWYAGRQVIWAPLFLAPGLLGAAAIGFGFYALFQIQEEEPRCWVIIVAEGQEEWYSAPVPPSSESGNIATGPSGSEVSGPSSDRSRPYQRITEMGPFGEGVRRSICTSDIITNREAAFGLGGVGAGVLLMVATLWLTLTWKSGPHHFYE